MNQNKDTKLEKLLKSLDRVYPSTTQLIWRSFLHGLFTALGATIGLAIIVSIVTYILTQAKFIPYQYRNEMQQVLPKK